MESFMHVLEGKIFVHHRRNEILKIIRGGYEYGCYFECFIGAKNFIGHFYELDCQLGDQVRIVYEADNNKNKIIALYNLSNNDVHLNYKAIIFSKWSIIHRYIPMLLIGFSTLVFIFSALFYVVTWNYYQAFIDSMHFSLFGLVLVITFIGLPFTLFKLYQNSKTINILRKLNVSEQYWLDMEKANPLNRVFHLNIISDQKKVKSYIKTYE